MSNYKMFGQLIRWARKESGMSQEELAQALGIAQGTVSKMECGDQLPCFEVALKLSHALNLDVVPKDKTLKEFEHVKEINGEWKCES